MQEIVGTITVYKSLKQYKKQASKLVDERRYAELLDLVSPLASQLQNYSQNPSTRVEIAMRTSMLLVNLRILESQLQEKDDILRNRHISSSHKKVLEDSDLTISMLSRLAPVREL